MLKTVMGTSPVILSSSHCSQIKSATMSNRHCAYIFGKHFLLNTISVPNTVLGTLNIPVTRTETALAYGETTCTSYRLNVEACGIFSRLHPFLEAALVTLLNICFLITLTKLK